ncbi:MAG: hypothetical protein FJY20_06480 [Bacteroidetes bacterium]|nr:hypothetical protein [Bacteroidota bacterium]
MKAGQYILVSLAVFSCFAAQPQQRVVDVGKEDTSPMSGLFLVLGGEPISLARYVKVVEGTPYFSDGWMLGSLVLPAGKRYDSIRLKIDLLADEVHYQDRAGNPLIANNRIREIWLTDSAEKKRYHFVHSSFIGSGTAAAAGWHLLLAEGKALLFKKPVKEIMETKPYGSATTEQHITTASRYFILYNNTFTTVKSLSSVAELLTGNTAELQQYIGANRLKGKSDADYISLVSYYNSLHVK